MDDGLIRDVSDTAFMVAAFRAMESARDDALFHDPLAAKLAGTHGNRIVEAMSRRAFLGQWYVVLRTCIIDDFVERAVAAGVDTVLNLGAGLDTRPYRMDLPRTLRWIEVDYPNIIALKESRLREDTPSCRLERVELDLAHADQRRSFLSRIAAASERALVLTEGVVPYLRTEEAARLADDLRTHRAYRYWVVDYFSPHTARLGTRLGLRMNMENAPFLFQPADYFAFFRSHGWVPAETRYIADEAKAHNRRLDAPLRFRLSLLRLLLSKSQREALKQSAAYVLFEPADPAAG